jgi:hypothetical protein
MFAVSFFWRETLLLVTLLILLSVLMLKNEGDTAALYLYASAFVLGPLSEAVTIYFGAWSYADPHIFGFPIWLPFVWGNASLFFRRAHIFLQDLSSS